MERVYKLQRSENEYPQTDQYMYLECNYGYQYYIGYGETPEEAIKNKEDSGVNAYATYDHNANHQIAKLINRLDNWKIVE